MAASMQNGQFAANAFSTAPNITTGVGENVSAVLSTTPETIQFVNISKQLVLYVVPVLFACGTVGNIMTISVLVRRGVTRTTTNFYLFFLSVSDLLCMYVGMPVFYLYELKLDNFSNFRALTNMVCRLHTFLTYSLTHLVAWTIVAMQVDRTIWVALPFRARQLCTVRKAGVIMLVIVLIIILVNNHFLWTLVVRSTEPGEEEICVEFEEYKFFANNVVGLMDVGMFSLVPSAIMFVCNTIITVKLRQFAKNRSRLLHATPNSKSQSQSKSNESNQSGSQRTRSSSLTHNSSSSSSSSSKERSLTIMLQTVSTFFIVTTLPICVTNLTYAFALPSMMPYSLTAMTIYGMQTIGSLLAYLNISVQFILYFLSCKSFRTDVRDMMNTWCNRCTCGFVCFARKRTENDVQSTGNGAKTNVVTTDFNQEHTKLTESIDASTAGAVSTNNVAGAKAQPANASKSILKRQAA